MDNNVGIWVQDLGVLKKHLDKNGVHTRQFPFEGAYAYSALTQPCPGLFVELFSKRGGDFADP